MSSANGLNSTVKRNMHELTSSSKNHVINYSDVTVIEQPAPPLPRYTL
jgi:hypothetical protein